MSVVTPPAFPAAAVSDAGRNTNHARVTPTPPNFPPSHFNPVPVAANLASGTPGVAYSETISVQGGTSAFTFAVTSGALPTGTTLNSSSGVISGTPSVATTFSFTITVTDSLGFTGSQAFPNHHRERRRWRFVYVSWLRYNLSGLARAINE